MLTVQSMFGAGAVSPSIGQRENRLVEARDAAIDACHGTQMLLVLHRGLFKPSMQIETVLFLSYPHISFKKIEKMN